MYTVLNVTGHSPNGGNIGLAIDNFETACRLAHKFQFEGVNIDLHEKEAISLTDKKELLTHYNLIPASSACSLKLTDDVTDKEFKDSLKVFEKDAEALNFLGCQLFTYSLDPFGSRLTYYDHFRLLVQRLKKVKTILEDHKIKLAIEFIGPTTRRHNVAYDFIHTIDGVRGLIAAAELEGHVGLTIDAYHWATSGAGILDLMHLETESILYVELNDADSQINQFSLSEYARELPLATGVVDVEGLLKELGRKQYEGPICIEPRNETISKMPPEEAIKVIKESLDDCMRILML